MLVSVLNGNPSKLVETSNIQANVLVINQTDNNSKEVLPHPLNEKLNLRVINTTTRGLSVSRNLAIENSVGDFLLFCDDDEYLVDDLEFRVTESYSRYKEQSVIIFKVDSPSKSMPERSFRLRKFDCLKVASWQITVRRQDLVEAQVTFNSQLGSGTKNGPGEEINFMLDLYNAGLSIFYVPVLIGSVSQMESNWFNGFNEKYFYDRGRFSRNTLGLFWGLLYIIYFVLLKKTIYQKDIQPHKAFYYSMTGYIFRSYEV